MYVRVEHALPYYLAQDLSFHTVRWDQGIGWNYSTWWDETSGLAGRQLRPYTSASTRFLRTTEEKKNEKERKKIDLFPQNQLIDRVNTIEINRHAAQPSTYTGLLVIMKTISESWWATRSKFRSISTACVSVCRKQEVRCRHSWSCVITPCQSPYFVNSFKHCDAMTHLQSHPCIRPELPERLWQDEELKESRGRHWGLTSCQKE